MPRWEWQADGGWTPLAPAESLVEEAVYTKVLSFLGMCPMEYQVGRWALAQSLCSRDLERFLRRKRSLDEDSTSEEPSRCAASWSTARSRT